MGYFWTKSQFFLAQPDFHGFLEDELFLSNFVLIELC
jgi:hypothetical protein